ncbi:MAG: hypothetical protein R3C11_25760 [Planctomycetaceae bacterium]
MFFRSFLLTAYVTVALMGSAGAHTVLEWLGACTHFHIGVGGHHHCSHGHHHDSHAGHGHFHPDHYHDEHAHHGHSHCSHGRPVNDSAEKNPEKPAEQSENPTHDSENCLVCQHFSLIAKSTSYVEMPVLDDAVDQSPLPAYEGEIVSFKAAFYRRGPPFAG